MTVVLTTVGWLVDCHMFLEAVKDTITVNKREFSEIIDGELSSGRRSKKVIRLLEKKMDASLCVMLAKRYRPG